MNMLSRLFGGFVVLLLAACGTADSSNPAPPRVTTAAVIPVQQSNIVVPVRVRLADLERRLDAEIPQTLYSIDEQKKDCVPAQKISICLAHKQKCKGDDCKDVGCKFGIDKTKITPDLSCHIVGTVQRGPIRVFGEGQLLRIAMPVSAEISAKDIGNVIKSETATAAAEARATAKLDLDRNWTPLAKVDIDYDWTEKPGVEMLGQRFTFAGKADPKLAKIIDKLEADLPRLLAEMEPRKSLEKAWASGFTTINVNRENPPAWLRITPRQLGYGGYAIDKGDIILSLALTADTEAFVGNRPADPVPTPLPPSMPVKGRTGFHFQIPVVADYSELEPVLAKALVKLSKKGIVLPQNVAVDVQFGKVTIYATHGGRLAVGLKIAATTTDKTLATKGTVWLTGIPYNVPGSQRVMVRDLTVDGVADTPSGKLMLAIAQAPVVQHEVANAVAQNFTNDFAKLLLKIDKALTEKQIGDFVLNVRIATVSNGVVQPVGQGVYMPVDVSGTGDLRFAPRK